MPELYENEKSLTRTMMYDWWRDNSSRFLKLHSVRYVECGFFILSLIVLRSASYKAY